MDALALIPIVGFLIFAIGYFAFRRAKHADDELLKRLSDDQRKARA